MADCATFRACYPDVIFLAEAFTRPKMMRALAKVGFTQSYTYFTWRNAKWELEEYLTELTQGPMREYYRGNFFANTPDILPHILQLGGRPAFRMRLVLAATLSSVYGIYSGFELSENTPRGAPGTSEYYPDSEMYQHKVWDWDRAGQHRRGRHPHQPHPSRESGASRCTTTCASMRATTSSCSHTARQRRTGRNIIVCVVNLDSTGPSRAGSTCRCRIGACPPISRTSCTT